MNEINEMYKITFNKCIGEKGETRLIAGQYITLNQLKLVKYLANFYLRPLQTLNIQINKSEMEG